MPDDPLETRWTGSAQQRIGKPMSEHPAPDNHDPLAEAVAAQALAVSRRGMLLRGIGKGSAALAAVVPITSLAATPSLTGNGLVCSTSGVGSAKHSGTSSLPTCGGMSPGYYKMASRWPNFLKVGAVKTATNVVGATTIYQNFSNAPAGTSPGGPNDTAFSAVFGGGSNNGMFYILKNQAPTDEFHWVAALLNAIWYKKSSSGWPLAPKVFPYSPEEVLALYATNYAKGLMFFKDYMEAH